MQQVDQWSKDLIDVEHSAKENATVLFFVVDNQTRNVVSDIEIAYLAGYNKRLVLVINTQGLVVAGSIVAGEMITSTEAKHMQTALAVLHEISVDQRIQVFDSIPQALNTVVQVSDCGGESMLCINGFFPRVCSNVTAFAPFSIFGI